MTVQLKLVTTVLDCFDKKLILLGALGQKCLHRGKNRSIPLVLKIRKRMPPNTPRPSLW